MMARASWRSWCVLAALQAATAYGWSAPLEISGPSGSERSTPRIARGAGGKIYVVYLNKGSPWQIYFRQKSPPGNWGPVELVSTAFSVRPDVAEDGQGRPHVIFASTNTGGAYDLYHTYKNNGVWTGGYLTTTNEYEDQPRLYPDNLGRVHLLYTKGTVESSSGTVIHRIWTSGNWSAEEGIGSVNNAYYHRPDLSIDASGNVHAVWIDLSGGVYRIRYRKYSGGAWGTTVTIGSGSTSSATTHFFNYARIAASPSNNLLVVWHDDASNGSRLLYNYSNNSGANWAIGLSGTDQGQFFYTGHYPQLDAGPSGSAHLISNLEPTEKILVYSKWDGANWVVSQQQINTNPHWQGWPDVAEDTNGDVHVVVDNPYGGGATNEHNIAYLTTASDVVPPAPVTNLLAVAAHNRVNLSWTNPFDPDFSNTVIRYSTSGYPSSANDGLLLADRSASPGSNDSYVHTGVTNGTTYYYAAFARDTGGLYSTAVTATATPYIPMDVDRDGDVDQSDFGALQNCFATPNSIPGCGWADFNTDGSINNTDLTAFLDCWSGPDVAYVPSCAG